MDQLPGLLFIALPLVLILLVFSRQRRQQRELTEVQAGIEPGTRVMTTSGLHATVVSVDTDTVVLEIAPGLHTTWVRQAIGQILTPEAGEQGAAAEPGAPPVEPT